ncbi:MAG: hypothetical protein M1839_004664 [Geoglossum umbratile]|nr:MAG: hypothetical protein M1839_004664 [Geoglossum umbratile]
MAFGCLLVLRLRTQLILSQVPKELFGDLLGNLHACRPWLLRPPEWEPIRYEEREMITEGRLLYIHPPRKFAPFLSLRLFCSDLRKEPWTPSLASAAQRSFARKALPQEQTQFLSRINNEAKVRQSTRSVVLGKAKVMSYEDLEEA